jgi:hypothetical protein
VAGPPRVAAGRRVSWFRGGWGRSPPWVVGVAGGRQAGAGGGGRAHRRCQQARNASRQGQVWLNVQPAAAGVVGEPGGQVPQAVAQRVGLGVGEFGLVVQAEQAGPGVEVVGDVGGRGPSRS